MAKEIRARFSKGVIEPLEKLELKEGEKIVVVIKEIPREDAFVRAAGSWKETLDFDEFLRDIYASRRHHGQEISL